MKIEVTSTPPPPMDKLAVAYGVFTDQESTGNSLPDQLQQLVVSDAERTSFKTLSPTYIENNFHLLVGLGNKECLSTEKLRDLAGVICHEAVKQGSQTLCLQIPPLPPKLIEAIVEGSMLSNYRFNRYKKSVDGRKPLAKLTIVCSQTQELATTVERAATITNAQNGARDLQNTPANELTPTRLGDHTLQLAKGLPNLKVEVEGADAIAARQMKALLAVSQGSSQEPALITLRYRPQGTRGKTIALVGKAVTFDTGGISIKPRAKMAEMKFDMSGGATVIQTMIAIAQLQLPVNVIGIVGASENMPGSGALKPGDIITTKSGLTVEVSNTDAEGRLVLCDCITYAIEQGAEQIIDIATLTGAVTVALGSTYAGLFSNSKQLAENLLQAGEHTGEHLWQLPLNPEYAAMVNGTYADLINAPEDMKARSSVAAEYLHRFAGKIPWAHIDIAGVSHQQTRSYFTQGGNGFGVRLLTEFISQQSY